MKKSLLAVALAATTAMAAAQTSVTLTKVLDIQVPLNSTGMAMGSSTYVPDADKFIVGLRGAGGIEVYNAQTGAYETMMSISGITPAGLGIFGVVASEDGVIYGYEDGAKDLWRWGSISDPAPEKVYDTPAFARGGATGKVGSDIAIALTGSGNDGPVEFFSDTFPFSSTSFTFNESVGLEAKPALAMNNAGDVVFTVGDSLRPLQRWEKSTEGVWNGPIWTSEFNGGPLAYDNEHDLVFGLGTGGSTANMLMVYDGATGDLVGEIEVESTINSTPQLSGGWVTPTETGGTVYLSGPGPLSGTPASIYDANFYVYDYVAPESSVNDWSLYQQ